MTGGPAVPAIEVGIDSALAAAMSFIGLYLIGYFVLLFGAGVALWRSGVLDRIPTAWTVIAAVIAVALGAMLALVSRRSGVKTRE